MWNSDGFHIELTILWPFHDHSIWNPWCPWNNELAVVSANIDSMDSTWNSTWIPWIPGGFHMDYTREGKDLKAINYLLYVPEPLTLKDVVRDTESTQCWIGEFEHSTLIAWPVLDKGSESKPTGKKIRTKVSHHWPELEESSLPKRNRSMIRLQMKVQSFNQLDVAPMLSVWKLKHEDEQNLDLVACWEVKTVAFHNLVHVHRWQDHLENKNQRIGRTCHEMLWDEMAKWQPQPFMKVQSSDHPWCSAWAKCLKFRRQTKLGSKKGHTATIWCKHWLPDPIKIRPFTKQFYIQTIEMGPRSLFTNIQFEGGTCYQKCSIGIIISLAWELTTASA